ncbi:zinc-binding protein A33-like [Trematomus bernacchii]|uniref:zinc-binding protein A33-like n=1 Tax=Trematomus bernacchii TaxID=40690 RepID=UPI00146A7373|nr:zinc-binding protein A33-like [Trematomus bernacchii]
MSDSKDEEEDKSPVPSGLSLKSYRSREQPPYFRDEPGPSDTKGNRKSRVPVEEQSSSCALCQDVLKDPISTSCGHWFCRQCIASSWEQGPPSGYSSCPQCGERCSIVQSKRLNTFKVQGFYWSYEHSYSVVMTSGVVGIFFTGWTLF